MKCVCVITAALRCYETSLSSLQWVWSVFICVHVTVEIVECTLKTSCVAKLREEQRRATSLGGALVERRSGHERVPVTELLFSFCPSTHQSLLIYDKTVWTHWPTSLHTHDVLLKESMCWLGPTISVCSASYLDVTVDITGFLFLQTVAAQTERRPASDIWLKDTLNITTHLWLDLLCSYETLILKPNIRCDLS